VKTALKVVGGLLLALVVLVGGTLGVGVLRGGHGREREASRAPVRRHPREGPPGPLASQPEGDRRSARGEAGCDDDAGAGGSNCPARSRRRIRWPVSTSRRSPWSERSSAESTCSMHGSDARTAIRRTSPAAPWWTCQSWVGGSVRTSRRAERPRVGSPRTSIASSGTAWGMTGAGSRCRRATSRT
jgi:hypothetical protein